MFLETPLERTAPAGCDDDRLEAPPVEGAGKVHGNRLGTLGDKGVEQYEHACGRAEACA